MLIQEKVQKDLAEARKRGNKELVEALKVILGEFARMRGLKDGKEYVTDTLTDIQAERVLNSIIKGEEKLLDLTGKCDMVLLSVAKSYVPEKITEEEILEFLSTIDFSKLKNKMQAVGLVKKEFGQAVDGSLASTLVRNLTV